MRFATSIVVVTLLAVPATVVARKIENWPYKRLFKEAGLVVIASAKETVDTTDEPRDKRWKNLVGQQTSFHVDYVLKGEFSGEELKVAHFRAKKGAMADGPMLVTFRTKEVVIEGAESVKFRASIPAPQYLLFLKQLDDGRYEPISGQIDPQLSVKEMHAPLSAKVAWAEQARQGTP